MSAEEAHTQETTPVSAPEIPSPPAVPFTWHAASLALVLILAGIAHAKTLGYELLGFDTLLQINAARIEVGDPERVWEDVKGTFTETLTNGRIAANFYRPLQNLSIALDYGLWGLNPWGYHLQSLIVYGLSVILLYLTSRRMLGPQSWLGPTIATGFYALHPILLNVVPFPCRRSETLVVLFLMLTLWILPQRKTGPGLLTAVAGLFVLLACGAKELGALGVGLVFLHQALYTRDASFLGRLARGTLATVPAFTLFGAYMINRTLVVKGLGGYERPQMTTYADKMSEYLPLLAADFFAPFAWLPSVGLAQWQLVGIVFGVLAVLVLLIGWASKTDRMTDAGRTTLIGLALIAPTLPLLGLSQDYYPWYGVIPLVGLALAMAGIGEWAATLLKAGAGQRGLGIVVTLGLLFVVVSPLQSSPLFHAYEELSKGSALMAEELAELREDKLQLPDGRTTTIELMPVQPPERDKNRPPLNHVSLLSLRSVRAIVDLEYPDRRVRATLYSKAEKWRASPGEILIKVRQIIPVGMEPGAESEE